MPRTTTRSRPAAPRARPRRRRRTARNWRTRIRRLLPTKKTRRTWMRRYRRLPGAFRVTLVTIAVAAIAVSANGIYQVIRKPTELFFPVSGVLLKTPEETWKAYGPIFRRHSTDVMTPEFLAALAQVEGSGNPVARTYWRTTLALNPFDIYRPASTAVGMYQITDGTFDLARRYCIHDHRVVEDGPWDDRRSCWFNALYSRVVPSHAVEMTSALLHRQVAEILSRHHLHGASGAQRRRLAAVIHLCGAGAGSAYARRGLAFAPGQRCGSHDPRHYIAKVEAMEHTFTRLTAD